jgi:hypothetical protein
MLALVHLTISGTAVDNSFCPLDNNPQNQQKNRIHPNIHSDINIGSYFIPNFKKLEDYLHAY